jgi:hypothetical protein
VEGCKNISEGMGIQKSTLTSGGFASAIGICLATLSAGTLVVFSVIAAGVGLDEPSTPPSVARAARGGAPAAITFPSTGRPSADNEGSRAPGNPSLLDVIGSAGSALDESTAAGPTAGSAQTAASDASGPADAGSDQVAALVPDIDLGGDNALSGPAESTAPRTKGGRDARPGDDAPKPGGKKDKDDDKVAARRDDDDDPDHADDDDDDDDSDSSGASDGSGLARGHAKAAVAKAKAKAKGKAKGHSKSVGVHKDRNKRHDSRHSHNGDSSGT